MRKIVLALIIILLNVEFSYSQTDTLLQVVRQQAEIMQSALLKRDMKTYVSYLYPKYFEVFGIGMPDSVQLSKDLSDIESITIGDALPIVKQGSELQSALPQIINFKEKDGKYTITYYLIAISEDNGKTWKFIELGKNNYKTLQGFLKNLSPHLAIPDKREEIIFAPVL